MDAVRTAQTETPESIESWSEELKPKTANRFKKLLAERKALATQAEYMRRVAVMLIPLVPKQTVARILQDAKGENWNAGPR